SRRGPLGPSTRSAAIGRTSSDRPRSTGPSQMTCARPQLAWSAPVAYGVARRRGNGRVAPPRRVLGNTSRRAGLLVAHAPAVARSPALLLGTSSAMAFAGGVNKVVRYGGFAVAVPKSWPVYDLRSHPSVCVRFDRHAVYLGQPSSTQRCPAHAAGRTEA